MKHRCAPLWASAGRYRAQGIPLGPHMNITLHRFMPAARAQAGTQMPAVAPLRSSMEGHQLSHRVSTTAPAQPLHIIFTLQIYPLLHVLASHTLLCSPSHQHQTQGPQHKCLSSPQFPYSNLLTHQTALPSPAAAPHSPQSLPRKRKSCSCAPTSCWAAPLQLLAAVEHCSPIRNTVMTATQDIPVSS